MDIFIIESNAINNISEKLLLGFQKKEISHQKNFKMHCFAYLMTDRILKEVYKIENREIIFEKSGKPYLTNRQKYFSISHTDEYLALAFADTECGIDIETIKQRDYISISRRMGFNSYDLESFYHNWTKYEAEYKLGTKASSFKTFNYGKCVITAVNTRPQEVFEIYIQSGDNFSNSAV